MSLGRSIAASITFFITVSLVAPALSETQLPSGFVRLADVAPTIRQDMRYAGRHNFTGRPVTGYTAATCILARPVAEALKRVQAGLVGRNLSLMVLDCYRPQRAVDSFVAWAQSQDGPDTKFYYPRIARSKIVPLGYVARVSSHSRGTAVDLTIVRLDQDGRTTDKNTDRQPTKAGVSCINVSPVRRGAQFAVLDMGTAFDCFDEKSRTRHTAIGARARANRRLLLRAMTAEGFRNYFREWWHFSLPLKRFRKTRNFIVD